ncbi:MDR family MFS transporter [Agrococcus jenensis]|uniref:EmrB/QacA subfamily drug resistance transporter n=1 Tax=Agrococcus jenensis TaxID=46353 RepID=A0A3N2AQ85_9MICO|nr:MDR family MFS transporter [Agrococcus jenensis]ROR65221.1 EmrB/QacA subfamily drug resistance transporter [Agrococcus jenensis]
MPQREPRSVEPREADEPLMSRRQIMLVLVGLMMAMFLSSLSQTVVGTSMRTIADDLHGLDLQVWVVTAFLIVSTIVTPIYGKLSDIFGRRPLFIIAIVLFLVGSILCSFAQDMVQLAAFRALQGLGAGGLMSLPLTIMGDVLSPRERAKYQGYFLAVFGVSSILGPLIGGVLAGADQLLFLEGWRWVFLFNLPIGAAALWMVWRYLHLPAHHERVRIDWWGAALLAVGVVPLLLVGEQGREWGWGSLMSIACYVVGAIGIVLFIVVERRMGDAALIPLQLFRNRTFSMATVLGVFTGFGMFAGMMMIPFVLQIVHGMNPTEAGLSTLPMILGLMIASIGSGQVIARTGRYSFFPVIGLAVMAIGYGVLVTLQFDTPLWMLLLGQLLLGLGLGQLMQTLTIASQNAVDPKDMGVATSSATFFRQLGGTAGVAVVFSMLYSRLPETLQAAFGRQDLRADLATALEDPNVLADPGNERILGILQNPAQIGGALNEDSSFLNTADPRLAAPFLDGFSNATTGPFWAALVVVLVALVLALFFKAPPLRQKSAMEEAMQQRAERAQLEADASAPGSVARPVTASNPIVSEGAARRDGGRSGTS